MKFITATAALLCLVAPAAAQDHPTLAGNYKKIAACVYRTVDTFVTGSYRLTDLVDDIELTQVIPVRGVPIQTMKATFRKISDDVTALDIATESKLIAVRSIATRCAG